MSANDAETDASNDAEQDDDGPGRFRLGDGIAVEYQAIEGGMVRLTFYAGADTATMREICVQDVSPDFHAKHDNERGAVKNRLLEAVDEHCGDDVSKQVVQAGYEELCRAFEKASVVDDEDLRSPIVNRLLHETDTVEVHTGDNSATFTIRLEQDDGGQAVLTFDQGEWASDNCGTKIREQYLVAHTELIEVTGEEWRTLRDIWNDRIDRIIHDETGETDEIAHDLVRRLKQRIRATEDYDELRNDTKIALYDRENTDRADPQIQKRYGDVDVLWIQASAINEVLDEIPGASTGRECKSPLASRLIEEDTLLRGAKKFGADKLPVWAFDPEPFGGQDLLTDDDDDDDQAVSI